jgi:uncharacterized glyoxalase superfamily protein PhnB
MKYKEAVTKQVNIIVTFGKSIVIGREEESDFWGSTTFHFIDRTVVTWVFMIYY